MADKKETKKDEQAGYGSGYGGGYGKGYGKMPLWVWIVIYVIVGGLVYYGIYAWYRSAHPKTSGSLYGTSSSRSATSGSSW